MAHAVACLGAGFALAACGGSSYTEDLSNAQAIIASAKAKTPVPPGARYNAQWFAIQPGMQYQTGYFLTVAEQESLCMWYLYWLQGYSSGNANQMHAAQRAFTAMQTWPLFTGDPNTGSQLDSIQQKAALGDPADMRQFVSQNCGGISP